MVRLVFLALISATCASPVKDLAVDLENWMGQLPDEIKEVALNYLAIPGSHDSFTLDITKKSQVSPDGAEILAALEHLPFVKTIISNWARTQGFNVTQQLEAGIRFFDLRLCHNPTDGLLYFCHSMYSTEVTSVLQSIRVFLDEHPKEVVILDCQHFYNFTSSIHADFTYFLQTTFIDLLVPKQSTLSGITLKNMIANKYQVFLIYRDSSQSTHSNLWPSSIYPTPWYDTMDQDSLISSLNSGLTTRSSNSGYISQLILTPSTTDLIEGFLSTLKKECAEDFEEKRSQWISEQKPGKGGVNVIIADYVDLSSVDFSKLVINLNANLVSVGLWGRIKGYLERVFG